MNYEKWYLLIKQHLADYKNKILGCNEKGMYLKNHKFYDHILPFAFANKNYIDNADINALKKDQKHIDWHHLNSSQTLCVNFFSILKRSHNQEDLSKLISYICHKSIEVESSSFEYVPVPNSTNFDFYILDKKGRSYYFEIKYTENGITKKGGGSNPHNAFNTFYKQDILVNKSFSNVSEDTFMNKHYQAYRNMVKGKNNDYSIFITMKSNRSTYSELQNALSDLKVESPKNIVLLYWEDFIDNVLDLFKDNDELVAHFKEFKRKYIPVLVE